MIIGNKVVTRTDGVPRALAEAIVAVPRLVELLRSALGNRRGSGFAARLAPFSVGPRSWLVLLWASLRPKEGRVNQRSRNVIRPLVRS